jgi:hypothetical protein
MDSRFIDDECDTYRTLLALFNDLHGMWATEVGNKVDLSGLTSFSNAKNEEESQVAGEIKSFGAHIAERLSQEGYGLFRDQVISRFRDTLAQARSREGTYRFNTPRPANQLAPGEPWKSIRIVVNEAPWSHSGRILDQAFMLNGNRPEIVCLVLERGVDKKLELISWLYNWDAILTQQPLWKASRPRVAVVGHGFGPRLTDSLADRRCMVVDRERGHFSDDPAQAVREKLDWDAKTPTSMTISQVFQWPGGTNPTSPQPNIPRVDAAYEAFPSHVLRAEFDAWIRHLSVPAGTGGSANQNSNPGDPSTP